MATRRAGTHCAAFFACIIPCNPYHHPEVPPFTHVESEAQSSAVTFSRVAQPGSGRAGMKVSIALHPQPQLLSRPRGAWGSMGSPHPMGQGGLLPSSRTVSVGPSIYILRPPRCGLLGAAPVRSLQPPPPPPASLGCLPLLPGLSQHLCCLQIIHARVIHARREASRL